MADVIDLNPKSDMAIHHHTHHGHSQAQFDSQLCSPTGEEESKAAPVSIDYVARQSTQYEQEIQFLLKVTHELQTTGECPLPILEDLVSTVYELRGELSNVSLSTVVVQQLNSQLEASYDRIFKYSDDLAQYIEILMVKMSDKSIVNRAEFMDIFSHIKYILPDLIHSVSQILNIVDKVDRILINQGLSDLNYDHEFFDKSKTIGDLKYFQAYLCQQGVAKLFNLKHCQMPDRALHYERFQNYISMLPIVCKNLVNQTQRRLTNTAPGYPINAHVNL